MVLSQRLNELKDKVAVITGGTSGIGLGIAQTFVDAGMKVAVTGTNRANIATALKCFDDGNLADRVHAIRVDVTDRVGMEAASAEVIDIFGKIHVLVANAGVIIPAALTETSYADWDWVLNVNLTGAFNSVKVFLPYIRSHGEGGHIVATSSIFGLFTPSSAGSAAYSVSKFAMVGMIEALRTELKDSNIGASVFCPGWVTSNLPLTSRSKYSGNPVDAGFPDEATKRNEGSWDELEIAARSAGELLLRGLRNNDLYIHTHAEFKSLIDDKYQTIVASIPEDRHLPERRRAYAEDMRIHSIYTSERTSQSMPARKS